MSVVVINLLLLSILVTYTISSNKNKSFNLFSPFCFPFIIFSVHYILPSTLSYIFLKQESGIGLQHILYIAGILSFLSGVYISGRFLKIRTEQDETADTGFIKGKVVPLSAFLLFGLMLLLSYGFQSGITKGLITGSDVEDLRRTAEIGKGYIKDSGLFLSSISGLWLIGNFITSSEKSLFSIKGYLIILSVSVVIFFTLGHKAATLLPILILVGLYNKYRYVSVFKIIAIGCCIFLLIGLINIFRAGDGRRNLASDLINKTFVVFNIYEANYVPIVKRTYKGNIDYQYGKEYLQGATSFIPRFLYPEKPISFDYFLKKKLNRTFSGGGLPPTSIGSLFLNFGFSGVILGMLLIGMCYNYLFNLYLRATYSKAVILLLTMYYIMNPSQFFRNIIFLLIFAAIIYMTCHFVNKAALSHSME